MMTIMMMKVTMMMMIMSRMLMMKHALRSFSEDAISKVSRFGVLR